MINDVNELKKIVQAASTFASASTDTQLCEVVKHLEVFVKFFEECIEKRVDQNIYDFIPVFNKYFRLANQDEKETASSEILDTIYEELETLSTDLYKANNMVEKLLILLEDDASSTKTSVPEMGSIYSGLLDKLKNG